MTCVNCGRTDYAENDPGAGAFCSHPCEAEYEARQDSYIDEACSQLAFVSMRAENERTGRWSHLNFGEHGMAMTALQKAIRQAVDQEIAAWRRSL